MYLPENSIAGLVWGLQNFDGIETDIRMTANSILAIHHDASKDGMVIRSMDAAQLEKHQIPTLQQLFEQEAVKLAGNSGKHLWIELKPDCNRQQSVAKEIAPIMKDLFLACLDDNNIPISAVRVISFSKDLLEPFIGVVDSYPILPYINECSTHWFYLKTLPRVLYPSMRRQLLTAADQGYRGVLFAMEYLKGPLSWVHPNYQALVELASQLSLELGTNVKSQAHEQLFPHIHRFTDEATPFPRHKKEGEGEMIIHRGTGMGGATIPDKQ